MPSCDLVVFSCDKYKDTWDIFFKLKEKYWKECPYKSYLVTETKKCEYSETISINQGMWTRRARMALERLSSDYVIVMLDDFFIRSQVDQARIESIINDFGDATYYNFETMNRPSLECNKAGFREQMKDQPYLNSCQRGIWDRKKLIEQLKDDMNPWEWEVQKINNNEKYYVNNSSEIIDIGHRYGEAFGITKGKWTMEAYKFLKKEGFDIDFNERGFYKGNTRNGQYVKLSVIIPYFNTFELTTKLLDNLCEQMTDEVEIILSDDGCNEARFDKYPINTIHLNTNCGVSASRNIALNEARGEFITFIDSDDQVSHDYIEKIINKIDTSKFDYCFFSWQCTNMRDDKVIITANPPEWNHSVWNCIYKRDIIKGDFNEEIQIGEDGEFNDKFRKGKRENITDILYFYNVGRKDSITQRFSKKEIKERVESNQTKIGIILYRDFLSLIGGIETAVYNFCLELKDQYDITFLYNSADDKQLARLSQLVKCVKYNGQQLACDTFIHYGFNPQHVELTLTANRVIQHVCCDVEGVNYRGAISQKTNIITADSKGSAEAFKRVYNRDCQAIHNIFAKPEPKRTLNLMTASRLAPEKGYERMKAMAKRMIILGIPFQWDVFTNEKPNEIIDGMTFRHARLNISDYVSNKDYGIQLSSSESWGCTTTEFLIQGIPMICTDYPSAKEQVKDGYNGYILKRDLSNMDEVIRNMYENNLKGFKHNADYKKEWINLLGEIPKKQIYEWRITMKKIKAIANYKDTWLDKDITRNTEYVVTPERAEQIRRAGFAIIIGDVGEGEIKSKKATTKKATTKKATEKKKEM